ncbi:MAG: zeta toxin family protein [Sphingomonas bacterium]
MPLKTPRKPDRPVLWIVAGPNGSGKSSFYNRTDIEGWGGSVWIINPDLLTQQIVEQEALQLDQANLAAVQRIQQWLEASIETYQTIGVETVLSSPKYRDLVLKARSRGFRVKMIYVLLRSAELQIERVRVRVSEGGHDVPVDKIVDRRRRSFAELAWFATHVDDCFLFDNSTGEPALLAARMSRGPLWKFASFPEDLTDALATAKIDIRPAEQ